MDTGTHPKPLGGPLSKTLSKSAPKPLPRVLSVFGTRPEAIKMAPVVHALARAGLEAPVCLTGQHREILDQVTQLFGIRPAADLQCMRPGQGPDGVVSAVMLGLAPVLARLRPDCLLVHGDTATTLGAALAGFFAQIPVGHVEAGLRTHDRTAPWPEEMNRRLVGSLAEMHFAPTKWAASNLRNEGVAEDAIRVTGNTAIDALYWVRDHVLAKPGAVAELVARFPWAVSELRLILVTGHRRENIGAGMEGLCTALLDLAARGDVNVVWPLHPNPAVRGPVAQRLGGHRAIHLIDPLDYAPFVWLMSRAHLILTDSGGIQEEAPALGVPCLVTRTATERPEALEAATARLVGTDPQQIRSAASALLDDPAAHRAMARAASPFGDGRASERIAARLSQFIAIAPDQITAPAA